jgi:hypothetical protein
MSEPFWITDTSAGFDGPIYAKNPHRTVFLGGLQLPGLCTVKATPSVQFDRQKVSGGDGASIILRGYLPGPIDIDCEIWLPGQWEIWQDIQDKIWTKPGKLAGAEKKKGSALAAGAKIAEREALDIQHPALRKLGIQRVVLVGISLPEPGSIPQSRVIRLKCMEYVATKVNATAKVKGATTAVARDKKLTTEKFPSTNSPGKSPAQAGEGGPNGPKPRGAHGGA